MQRHELLDTPGTDRYGRRAHLVRRARVAGAVLALLHLTTVYWLAQRPAPGPWVAAGSVVPLHTVRAYLALGPADGAWHLCGALLLLAPLGVLLPLVGGRLDVSPLASFARTTFGGVMLAFCAEVVRNGVAGQSFDTDVVLLNALGVALAHVAMVPPVRAALRRRGFGRSARREPATVPGARPQVGATP